MKNIVVTPGTGGLAVVATVALGEEHVDPGQSALAPVCLINIDEKLVQTAIDMVCSEAAHSEQLTFRVDGREVLPTWKVELLSLTGELVALAPAEPVRCPFGCGQVVTTTDAFAHGNFGCRR